MGSSGLEDGSSRLFSDVGRCFNNRHSVMSHVTSEELRSVFTRGEVSVLERSTGSLILQPHYGASVHPERQVSRHVDRPDSNCHHVVLCCVMLLYYIVLYYIIIFPNDLVSVTQLDSEKGNVYHDCNSD